MTYKWKTTEDYDWRSVPRTQDQLAGDLAEIEKEIAWNERRLQNLILNEEDRQQTEDMVADLRQERQRLLGAMEND